MNPDDRLGRNEAIFRDVNERIEQGLWPGERDGPVAFLCECASLGCNLLIDVTLGAYERVRADARRFILVPGHELDSIERVVERHSDYVVVEKRGAAGAAAQETDPRDD
jgi:hypothetical protein